MKTADIHVVPEFEGEPKHQESSECWCGPEWINQTEADEFGDAKVWSHHRPS